MVDWQQEEVSIREFVEAMAVSEAEAKSYAAWFWYLWSEGEADYWRRVKVRFWDMVLSMVDSRHVNVTVTPRPTLVVQDPLELEGVDLVKCWLFRWDGGGSFTLVASTERDGWERYKRVYRQLKSGK